MGKSPYINKANEVVLTAQRDLSRWKPFCCGALQGKEDKQTKKDPAGVHEMRWRDSTGTQIKKKGQREMGRKNRRQAGRRNPWVKNVTTPTPNYHGDQHLNRVSTERQLLQCKKKKSNQIKLLAVYHWINHSSFKLSKTFSICLPKPNTVTLTCLCMRNLNNSYQIDIQWLQKDV